MFYWSPAPPGRPRDRGAEQQRLGVAQFGSAPDSGSGGRGFNSLHPDRELDAG